MSVTVPAATRSVARGEGSRGRATPSSTRRWCRPCWRRRCHTPGFRRSRVSDGLSEEALPAPLRCMMRRRWRRRPQLVRTLGTFLQREVTPTPSQGVGVWGRAVSPRGAPRQRCGLRSPCARPLAERWLQGSPQCGTELHCWRHFMCAFIRIYCILQCVIYIFCAL